MIMAKGGRRPNAGNKKGGVRFSEWVTPEQKHEFVKWIMANYKSDKRLAVWLGDHMFGKAPQPVEGTGENGELIIKLVGYADDNDSA